MCDIDHREGFPFLEFPRLYRKVAKEESILASEDYRVQTNLRATRRRRPRFYLLHRLVARLCIFSKPKLRKYALRKECQSFIFALRVVHNNRNTSYTLAPRFGLLSRVGRRAT